MAVTGAAFAPTEEHSRPINRAHRREDATWPTGVMRIASLSKKTAWDSTELAATQH